MKRLIEAGLMFGNMVEVASPILVARYNRALKRLTGKETALENFWIDVSGYSPEIGVELDDPLYLNPNGVNRQFILLTPDQKTAPLLNAQFSYSRDILRGFIARNEAQLFALTIQDAVTGELVNSVFQARNAAQLLEIDRIEIDADTTDGTLSKAHELSGKISEFMERDNAWHEDVLIAQIIELAKTTGDVTRNPLQLSRETFDIKNFWTTHFGGAFVFRFGKKVTIIANVPDAFSGIEDAQVLGFADRAEIAQFLFDANLVEPIVRDKGARGADILQSKMDFMAVEAAAQAGETYIPADTAGLRRLTRRFADAMPEAHAGIWRLYRWATGNGRWPRIASDDAAYFYLLRATPGGNRDLVNRLLSEMTPLDVRQMFICHKEAFYGHYASWPEAKQVFVVDLLRSDYLNNKQNARDALFGEWEDPVEVEIPSKDDLIEAVGPWGSVRRGRGK